MAGRKYSNQSLKRKIFGGGKGHKGLWGQGASDSDLKQAKEADRVKDESDATKRRMRTGNPDAPLFGPKQGK